MALIFSRTRQLSQPLAPFGFGDGLELQVLPFDLEHEELLGVEHLRLPLAIPAQMAA